MDNKNLFHGICQDMRHDILTMCHNCGTQNGHLGGCMSAVEILAYLYTSHMNLSDANSGKILWEDRDRFIMSKGHAGMAMYAALKQAGVISQETINKTMRGEGSLLFRHPKINKDFAIECSVGSLGMGLGYGIGIAEALKRKNKTSNVYVMIGDGECNEGSVWESAAYASHRKLDNLVVIIDKNNLQLDGFTTNISGYDNMAERWSAFGFETVEINGHDYEDIKKGFNTKHSNKPLAIIANTIKGKGASFAENKVEWHDNFLSDELFALGQKEIGNSEYREVANKQAKERFENKNHKTNETTSENNFSLSKNNSDYNRLNSKVIVGDVVKELAVKDDRFALVYSDCGVRIGIDEAEKNAHPNKFYEVGIAEQTQICLAAGLASEGFNVVAVAYAPFITGRVLDQIRVNLGYMKLPVILIGLSSGYASSDLGATHTSLEDIILLRSLPNVDVYLPADSCEIAQSMCMAVNNRKPAYIRVTTNSMQAPVYDDNFALAYDKATLLKDGKDIAIVSGGAIAYEAVECAKVLKNQGVDCAVYNLSVAKPVPQNLNEIINNFNTVVSLEEHCEFGGVSSILSELIVKNKLNTNLISITTPDKYFVADVANNEREKAGLGVNQIVETILKNIK